MRYLDTGTFEDCVRVLRMDARCRAQEVHVHFANGSVQFEALARPHRVLDVNKLKSAARNLAERIGPAGPFARETDELAQLLKENC